VTFGDRLGTRARKTRRQCRSTRAPSMKKPRASGVSQKAADGIRTHDLLHGKRVGGSVPIPRKPALGLGLRPLTGVVANWHFRPDSGGLGGVLAGLPIETGRCPSPASAIAVLRSRQGGAREREQGSNGTLKPKLRGRDGRALAAAPREELRRRGGSRPPRPGVERRGRSRRRGCVSRRG